MDYLFGDLLSLLPDDADQGRFCPPARSLLSRYDHRHGTELYQTLKVFVQSSCNHKDTAAALYIHRNSLAYRMEKITEFTGLDLSNSRTRFILYMSYEIDRYTGRDY